MKHPISHRVPLRLVLSCIAATLLVACGGGRSTTNKQPFFTSGNREADQRASQRMAKAEQLAGSGEGAGEKENSGSSKGDSGKGSGSGAGGGAHDQGKQSLFERLGGENGISAIVNDFLPRAMQDPRANWARKGVKRGGLLHHGPAVTWTPTPQNVDNLKKHIVQFLALTTGGPAHYDGKEIKGAHQDMQISNPEFDAVVGDLKATLDNLKIPNQEQKELLAIIESTREEIVTVR